MSRAGHARRLSAFGLLFGPTAPRTPDRKNEDERYRRDDEEDPCVDAEKGGPSGRRGPGGWPGGHVARRGGEKAHVAAPIRGIDPCILVAATSGNPVGVAGASWGRSPPPTRGPAAAAGRAPPNAPTRDAAGGRADLAL